MKKILLFIVFSMSTCLTAISTASDDAPINISLVNDVYDTNSEAVAEYAALVFLLQEIYEERDLDFVREAYDSTAIPNNLLELSMVEVLATAGDGRGGALNSLFQWFATASISGDVGTVVSLIFKATTGEDLTYEEWIEKGIKGYQYYSLLGSLKQVKKYGEKAPFLGRLSPDDFSKLRGGLPSFVLASADVINTISSEIAVFLDPNIQNYISRYRPIISKPTDRNKECLLAITVGQGARIFEDISREVGGFSFGLRFKQYDLSNPTSGTVLPADDFSFRDFMENDSARQIIKENLRVVLNEFKIRCGLSITENNIFVGETLLDNGPDIDMDTSIPWAGYADFPFRMFGEVIECNVPIIPFLGGGCRSGLSEVSPSYLAPLTSQPLLLDGFEVCGPPRVTDTPGWSYTSRYYLMDSRGVITNPTDITFQCHINGF